MNLKWKLIFIISREHALSDRHLSTYFSIFPRDITNNLEFKIISFKKILSRIVSELCHKFNCNKSS